MYCIYINKGRIPLLILTHLAPYFGAFYVQRPQSKERTSSGCIFPPAKYANQLLVPVTVVIDVLVQNFGQKHELKPEVGRFFCCEAGSVSLDFCMTYRGPFHKKPD
jgi:hypothetical protein